MSIRQFGSLIGFIPPTHDENVINKRWRRKVSRSFRQKHQGSASHREALGRVCGDQANAIVK